VKVKTDFSIDENFQVLLIAGYEISYAVFLFDIDAFFITIMIYIPFHNITRLRLHKREKEGEQVSQWQLKMQTNRRRK
jgi:hypothetical protein